MKLDGLISTMHVLQKEVKRDEKVNCMPSRQRKRLLYMLCLLYAMMFSWDLLTSILKLKTSFAGLVAPQPELANCLEDYWAAYDKSSELLKVTEPGARRASFVGSIVASKLSVTMGAQQEKVEGVPLTRGGIYKLHGGKVVPRDQNIISEV